MLAEEYVGKCYKYKDKYYKVLSNYSTNPYRFTCLTFDINGKIYRSKFLNKDRSHYDFPNINIDINIFEIEDVFVFGNPLAAWFLDKSTEISEDEFNKAMDKKIEKFIEETKNVNNDVNKMINKYIEEYLKED